MFDLQINLEPHIEQRIKYLINKNPNKEKLFTDLISYKIAELEKALFEMEKDLRKYEKQYQISSEVFYQLFEDGKYGDEDDYMIWAGLYELSQNNKNELIKLQW